MFFIFSVAQPLRFRNRTPPTEIVVADLNQSRSDRYFRFRGLAWNTTIKLDNFLPVFNSCNTNGFLTFLRLEAKLNNEFVQLFQHRKRHGRPYEIEETLRKIVTLNQDAPCDLLTSVKSLYEFDIKTKNIWFEQICHPVSNNPVTNEMCYDVGGWEALNVFAQLKEQTAITVQFNCPCPLFGRSKFHTKTFNHIDIVSDADIRYLDIGFLEPGLTRQQCPVCKSYIVVHSVHVPITTWLFEIRFPMPHTALIDERLVPNTIEIGDEQFRRVYVTYTNTQPWAEANHNTYLFNIEGYKYSYNDSRDQGALRRRTIFVPSNPIVFLERAVYVKVP